nr:FmdB family zinc ribbon protein [Actinopolyspora sp. BKK1]
MRPVPTYQYACTECGHDFETFQSLSENSLTECPECSGKLRKLFNAVGVVFKGSGFYRTGSRNSNSSSESASSANSSGDSSGGSSPSNGGSGSSDSSGSSSSGDSGGSGAQTQASAASN